MEDSDKPRPGVAFPERIWTPWRMQYIGGGRAESGCIFCNRLAADDDVISLILLRAPTSFVIMNLYPYNTGHVMLVPNEHVASPEDAQPDALAEIATLLPFMLRAARRALSCHGFNVGVNVGAVAGAGVADHLHEHVVPRWNGDASFMPILAGTMVIPELIPVTYAKLRAELARELNPGHEPAATVVILDRKHNKILVDSSGMLPVVSPTVEKSIWRAAVERSAAAGVSATVAGWAGPTRATIGGEIAITLTSTEGADAKGSWIEIGRAMTSLPEDQRVILQRALDQLSPAG
jgi:ATP adenylyltransferase